MVKGPILKYALHPHTHSSSPSLHPVRPRGPENLKKPTATFSSLATLEKAKGHYHSITLRSSKYWFGKPFLSLKVQLMQQPIWVNCLPIISLSLPFPLYPCGVFNPKEQVLPLLTVLPVCPPIRQETISPETRRKCSLVSSLGLGYHLNKFLVFVLAFFQDSLTRYPNSVWNV